MPTDHDFQIVELAARLLSAQQAFMSNPSDRSASDDFSLGYVAGLLDFFMQRAKIEGHSESFALVTILMIILFGEENGPLLAGRFLDSQQRPETQRGLMAGCTDAQTWAGDPKRTPSAWYLHCG